MRTLVCHVLLLVAILPGAQSQNVGVGTPSPDPSAQLDIVSDSSGVLIPRMTAVQRDAIDSPATGLLVFVTNDSAFYFFDGTDWITFDSRTRRLIDIDGDTRVEVEQGPDDDVIRFSIKGTEFFRMDSGRLEVVNTGGGVSIGEGAGASNDLTNNRNVAIGQAALFHNVDRGRLVAVGDSALYNNSVGAVQNSDGFGQTAVGSKALFANTTGFANTAIGLQALSANTVGAANTATGYTALNANVSGSSNSAFGYRALFANESGSENTAIGMRALFSNTDRSGLVAVGDSALLKNGQNVSLDQHAAGNTAIGSKAMLSNTTGYANVGLGYRVIYSNATGIYNTAVGYDAMFSSTASYNTAFGALALYENTTGSFNTAVGLQSLAGNTEGMNNTALGGQSLIFNTTGNDNSAMGYQVLVGNLVGHGNTGAGYRALYQTTGSYNTAYGAESMYFNTLGSMSTAIGHGAGYAATGDGHVFIGYQAGYNESGDSTLYIENSSSATPLIFGDFAADSVRVHGDLGISGALRVGPSPDISPPAGTIRWNEVTQDFEGYTGSEWKSLTFDGGSWGNTAQSTESSGLIAADGMTSDNFGSAVAISGDYVLIGASDGGSIDQGKAYVFERSGSGWTLQDSLLASDGMNFDLFGAAVSIEGDYAVVGAPFASEGKAYVFHRSGASWPFQDTLLAGDNDIGDGFGYSTSISGDYAVVGAQWHDTQGDMDRGKAYVFQRSGSEWVLQDSLVADDGAAGDLFGASISISGDYAVVGSPWHNTQGDLHRGKAYVFHRNGSDWTFQDSLVADDGAADDQFGFSVAITGDLAVAGASYHDVFGKTDQGKVYLFQRSGTDWDLQGALIADDGSPGDRFGASVSISGNDILVGASGSDVGNPNQGKSYVFRKVGGQWMQQAVLVPSDGASDDLFGLTGAISEDHCVVGSRHDVNGNNNQGKVYIFNKN